MPFESYIIKLHNIYKLAIVFDEHNNFGPLRQIVFLIALFKSLSNTLFRM
jgi:hypothetical protein